MYVYLGKLILALAFVLHGAAPVVTHVLTDTNRIIGGSVATDVDTSFVVYFHKHYYVDEFACGGSIINKQTILTAAHCLKLYPVQAKDIKVYAGTKNHTWSGGLSVEAFHVHPNFWNGGDIFANDIALIRLATPLTFSSTIRAIRLADVGEAVQPGSWATVFGWGDTETEDAPTTRLRYTAVPIISEQKCRELEPELKDDEICASFDLVGSDACQGDSGGPLVQEDKVIGIVSWGDGCGVAEHPGVYASVSVLRPWVEQTLAENYNEQL